MVLPSFVRIHSVNNLCVYFNSTFAGDTVQKWAQINRKVIRKVAFNHSETLYVMFSNQKNITQVLMLTCSVNMMLVAACNQGCMYMVCVPKCNNILTFWLFLYVHNKILLKLISWSVLFPGGTQKKKQNTKAKLSDKERQLDLITTTQ